MFAPAIQRCPRDTGRRAYAARAHPAFHQGHRIATYVSAVHNSSLAGATDNSELRDRILACPGWESNPHFTGFESARSASWRTGALLALWGQQDDNLPDHGTLGGMSQNPLRVVIAEDEALIRLDLKEMLRSEGYSVVAEAGDGATAGWHAPPPRPGPAPLDRNEPGRDVVPAAPRIAPGPIAPPAD